MKAVEKLQLGYAGRPERLRCLIEAASSGEVNVFDFAVQFGVNPWMIRKDVRDLILKGLIGVGGGMRECASCSQQGILVCHHWLEGDVFHVRSVCCSCNVRLGKLFKGHYPPWDVQVAALVRGGKGE